MLSPASIGGAMHPTAPPPSPSHTANREWAWFPDEGARACNLQSPMDRAHMGFHLSHPHVTYSLMVPFFNVIIFYAQ
jgi:hypothetical protein